METGGAQGGLTKLGISKSPNRTVRPAPDIGKGFRQPIGDFSTRALGGSTPTPTAEGKLLLPFTLPAKLWGAFGDLLERTGTTPSQLVSFALIDALARHRRGDAAFRPVDLADLESQR